MSYRGLLVLFSVLLMPFHASAENQRANNMDGYIERLVKTYKNYKAISFDRTGKNYSLTALYENESDKDPVKYFAEVKQTEDGAEVWFTAYNRCAETGGTRDFRLLPTIIEVSGQKINGHYACLMTHEGITRAIYSIKSDAGKEFVKKEFSTGGYVFVVLHGLPVPFDVDGFMDTWRASSGKAL